ncbi:unnamed protein product [Cylicostephanus goldi]|uniref:Uncharacterized protein n=1 Tax=Cylicostephanus goldi TaxID=71465 RepID=A0A3P6SHT5_CYLGO|nr:unnamed protein product [Cylicostephanus goldi]
MSRIALLEVIPLLSQQHIRGKSMIEVTPLRGTIHRTAADVAAPVRITVIAVMHTAQQQVVLEVLLEDGAHLQVPAMVHQRGRAAVRP